MYRRSKTAYLLAAVLLAVCAGCSAKARPGAGQPESVNAEAETIAGSETGPAAAESAESEAALAAIETIESGVGLAAVERAQSENSPATAETAQSETSSAAGEKAKNETVPAAGETADSGAGLEAEAADSSTEKTVGAADNEQAAGAELTKEETDEQFYAIMIPDEIFESMQGKTYKDYCIIPREDLRYLHVLHVNIYGETLEGEMVCHEIIAEALLEIFRELYENKYPIEKMRLMDVYDADDEAGMTDNNSSCFNYRTISHTNRISKHGLGVAVDINTLYNPYTKVVDGERIVEPAAGWPYLDRTAEFPYKLQEGDLCWRLFTEHGFEWGGAWRSSKDYQHFELPDSITDRLRARY